MRAVPLSFADATFTILTTVGEPLHYKDIAQRAFNQNLIQPDGETPEDTLNAVLAVDIKQKGEHSRFVRVKPGVFGLRVWHLDQSVSLLSDTLNADDDQRVRIPHFPLYSEVRLILPIWNGRLRSQITKLHSTIATLRGSPQEPVDWTDPATWIPQRLQGSDRELAEAVWMQTGGTVNPRHIYGHWLLACNYNLLEEDRTGYMSLTASGQDFITHTQGNAVSFIDEAEGLLKLLTIVAEKGTGKRGDFIPEWTEYLQRYSRLSTDSTIKNALGRRLQNLLDRDLLSKTSTTYTITDKGLAYLNQTGGSEDTEVITELQQILALITKQRTSIRSSIQELLETIDPIAFEYLVKQLLEAMNYQNVSVTSSTNDKGVDVKADIEMGITSVREVVQVKRHKGNIQRPVLDALRGSLHRFDAVRGTIITTGDFSKGTAAAAVERGAAPITLINGEKLIDLLIEHKIGVRTKPIEILELDADAFAQSEIGNF